MRQTLIQKTKTLIKLARRKLPQEATWTPPKYKPKSGEARTLWRMERAYEASLVGKTPPNRHQRRYAESTAGKKKAAQLRAAEEKVS